MILCSLEYSRCAAEPQANFAYAEEMHAIGTVCLSSACVRASESHPGSFTVVACYTGFVDLPRCSSIDAIRNGEPMNIESMFERNDVDQLVQAFLLLDSVEDVRAFLTDLCTPREICDFAQRLQVARFLDEGEPYVEVQARTGASSTTVSRVSKALNGEYGGYRRVLVNLEGTD